MQRFKAKLEPVIKKSKATAAWEKPPPSHRREHVNAVLDAKKPETRARRIEKAIAMLLEAVSPRSRKQHR